jgi:predicted DNA-binding protein
MQAYTKKNEMEDYELQQNVLTKLLRDTKAHINHKSNWK